MSSHFGFNAGALGGEEAPKVVCRVKQLVVETDKTGSCFCCSVNVHCFAVVIITWEMRRRWNSALSKASELVQLAFGAAGRGGGETHTSLLY